jgi:6-phosphogluconate dehydrogenase
MPYDFVQDSACWNRLDSAMPDERVSDTIMRIASQHIKGAGRMQLGLIGLGKMGANMTRRLLNGGHQLVVSDLSSKAVEQAQQAGAIGCASLAEMVTKLAAPRAVWVMVPAGDATESTIRELATLLQAGDIIIDGGNSNYKDTIRLGQELALQQIQLLDVGTSGGVWGLENGYSLMIGGQAEAVEHLRPIFETLAPAADKGWGHVGSGGAGHFTKMIHNGIEYGMMQAFAEGFAILRAKEEFALDLEQVSGIWQHGSVVRSWLLDLIHDAFGQDQELAEVAAWVPDSGEGRWTAFEAIDLNVAAPVITLALQQRIRSRSDGYTEKLLSVMRNQFGGHAVRKAE